MQKALNKFLNGTIPFYILMSLIIFGVIMGSLYVISDAYGAPYPFDRTDYSVTISSLPNEVSKILMDIDEDGRVDCIYNHDGDVTLTKVFGTNCMATITITAAGVGGNEYIGQPRQDKILTFWSEINPNCNNNSEIWNATDGTRLYTNGITGTTVLSPAASTGVIDNNGKPVWLAMCTSTVFDRFVSPFYNSSNFQALTTTYQSINHLSFTNGSNVTYDILTNVIYVNTTNPTVNEVIINNTANHFTGISSGALFDIIPATNYPASSIDFYRYNFKIPNDNYNTQNTLMNDNVITPTNTIEGLTATLELEFIESGFDKANTRFVMENSTSNYIATWDSGTIKYFDYAELSPQMSNRAFGYFNLDTSDTDSTKLASNGAPATLTVELVKPDLSTTSFTYSSLQLLPSGYGLKDPTNIRFYKAEYTNDISNYVPLKTFSGAHSELTLEIKNAFPDTAVRLRDSVLYNGLYPYVWLIDELQTDNTITFDLIPDTCIYVDIKNIGLSTSNWTELGFLCHNGLTYKVLPNTSELSYQFWAFPLGANHIFNNTNNMLQTQVRGQSAPFEYVTQLHDANDVLVHDVITNSSSLVNLQTINASNYTKPLFLSIFDFDNSNQTVYTASVGFPSYLAGIGLFINQYLVYEGFNLMMLMPLVFIAMFTRNTIGYGVVITVVFIMALVWLGLLQIPEYVLYTMLVVAVIGLIAYKVRS